MSSRPMMGARLLMAVALAVSVAACDDEPVSPPLAWLVEFGGAVRIDRADSAEGASQDAPLYAGNVISTGAAAKATVRYANRTQVTVGENTRFKIGGANGNLTLELEAGTILSSSRQGVGEGTLTIVTRFGRMQMLEGSEISFSLGSDGESSMEVLSGSIELLSPDGSKVTVLEGEEWNLDLGTRSTVAAATPDAGAPAVEAAAEPLPVQQVFAALRGKATLRGRGTKSFSAAPSRETPVEAGTEFRVAKGAQAVLRGKGVSSRLSAQSSGVIGEAKQVGDSEQYALSLEAGAAELEFAHSGNRTMALKSRGREATLESAQAGSVGVAVGRTGMEFVVRAGEVKLTAGGETRTLSTGDRVDLVGNVLKPTRKLQASLALPLSRKVRVYANRLGTVELGLPEHSEPVRVEVARDPEFSDRVLSGMVSGDSVVVNAPASGELYWRALDADEKELGKGQARFFADKGQSDIDLDNPRAEVAETGLKATVLFQSVAPAITFSFAPKPNAAGYRVRVFRSNELKRPLVEKVVQEPKAAFEAGQIPEGEYLWNATPLAAAGGELSGGRMNRLELTYDNSRTSLAIARPRMNDVVSASARATEVSGVAPIGSRLFVNGKAITLGAKGRFSQQLPRADTLVFRLVTENGAEGYWVRQLRRRP